VQAFSLRGQEGVRRGVAQPRPGIGSAFRLETEEIAHRALRPDGGRMQRADRREAAVRARQVQQRRLAVEDRQMHDAGLSPQAEQRNRSRLQAPGGVAPGVRVDEG
jgi:hypothetical protein